LQQIALQSAVVPHDSLQSALRPHFLMHALVAAMQLDLQLALQTLPPPPSPGVLEYGPPWHP